MDREWCRLFFSFFVDRNFRHGQWSFMEVLHLDDEFKSSVRCVNSLLVKFQESDISFCLFVAFKMFQFLVPSKLIKKMFIFISSCSIFSSFLSLMAAVCINSLLCRCFCCCLFSFFPSFKLLHFLLVLLFKPPMKRDLNHKYVVIYRCSYRFGWLHEDYRIAN